MKAAIVKVGGFVNTCIGLQPVGWHFDGKGQPIVALDIGTDAIRWAGWTVPELQEIAQRPSEFVEMDMPQ